MQVKSMEQLGELIRSTRRRQGLTQEALAGACGVGPRFIAELEKGKPSCEIGKALRVVQMLGIRLFTEGPGSAQ